MVGADTGTMAVGMGEVGMVEPGMVGTVIVAAGMVEASCAAGDSRMGGAAWYMAAEGPVGADLHTATAARRGVVEVDTPAGVVSQPVARGFAACRHTTRPRSRRPRDERPARTGEGEKKSSPDCSTRD